MRDMATNLGGLLMGCYICERKPPKLQAISLRRIRSSVLLVRFAQPAKLRLRKPPTVFSAQDDRLIVKFAIYAYIRENLFENIKEQRTEKNLIRCSCFLFCADFEALGRAKFDAEDVIDHSSPYKRTAERSSAAKKPHKTKKPVVFSTGFNIKQTLL